MGDVNPDTEHRPDALGGDQPARRRPLSNRAQIWGVIVAGASMLIALLAWLLPIGGSGGQASDRNPDVLAPVPGSRLTVRPVPVHSSATADTSVGGNSAVPLTDIDPSAGATNLRPGPSGTLVIGCPTNQSDDLTRTVTYDLLGAYHTFTGSASVAGFTRPEAEAEVELLVDNTRVNNQVFAPGQHAPLTAALDGANTLAIRITCRQRTGTVSITDPVLTR
ncbi:MAG TPA: hypothetical protein VFX70_16805 [Mycobacteriales bacterium]|nr:hypothetical protein [Mycobacteriales bacterium]